MAHAFLYKELRMMSGMISLLGLTILAIWVYGDTLYQPVQCHQCLIGFILPYDTHYESDNKRFLFNTFETIYSFYGKEKEKIDPQFQIMRAKYVEVRPKSDINIIKRPMWHMRPNRWVHWDDKKISLFSSHLQTYTHHFSPLLFERLGWKWK